MVGKCWRAAAVAFLAVAHGAHERRLAQNNTDVEPEPLHRVHVLKKAALAVIATRPDETVVTLAQGVLDDLARGAGIEAFSAETVQLVETAYAETQSAETAFANGALITSEDVVNWRGVRDEDLGCSGRCYSFEGDMAFPDRSAMEAFEATSRRLSTWAGTPWTGGHIRYCFASDVPANIRHLFEVAVRQYKKAMPCLSFENVGLASGSSHDQMDQQRCNGNGPAIFVMAAADLGCYSYVGMISQWASQQLQLQPQGCDALGIVIHEIGHAVGMAHEHERPDRDGYVRINWHNIQPQWHSAFEIQANSYDDIAYDYESAMHYNPFAFSMNNEPTIVRAGGGHDGLGQRTSLSGYDLTQLQRMYAPENAVCASSARAGQGCENLPDDHGNDICSSVQSCHGLQSERCCACGGGLLVQCYHGQPCPSAADGSVPPAPSQASCLETYFDGRGSCIFRNNCPDQGVFFHCPSRACTFSAGSGDWLAQTCHDSPMTQICEEPSACRIWTGAATDGWEAGSGAGAGAGTVTEQPASSQAAGAEGASESGGPNVALIVGAGAVVAAVGAGLCCCCGGGGAKRGVTLEKDEAEEEEEDAEEARSPRGVAPQPQPQLQSQPAFATSAYEPVYGYEAPGLTFARAPQAVAYAVAPQPGAYYYRTYAPTAPAAARP